MCVIQRVGQTSIKILWLLFVNRSLIFCTKWCCRLGELEKKSESFLTVPIILRINGNEQVSATQRFKRRFMQWTCTAIWNWRWINVDAPTYLPAILPAPSYDLLLHSSILKPRLIMDLRIRSLIASPVVCSRQRWKPTNYSRIFADESTKRRTRVRFSLLETSAACQPWSKTFFLN